MRLNPEDRVFDTDASQPKPTGDGSGNVDPKTGVAAKSPWPENDDGDIRPSDGDCQGVVDTP